MSNWNILSAFTCPHVSIFPFPKAASNDQDDPSVLPGTTAFGLGCPQKNTRWFWPYAIRDLLQVLRHFHHDFGKAWESWDSATELFHDFVQMFPAIWIHILDLLKWGQMLCPTLGHKSINNIITTTITITIIIIIIIINIIFFPKRFTRMTRFTLPFKISDLFSLLISLCLFC